MPGVGFLFLSTKLYKTGNGIFSTHPVLSNRALHLTSVSLKRPGSRNLNIRFFYHIFFYMGKVASVLLMSVRVWDKELLASSV